MGETGAKNATAFFVYRLGVGSAGTVRVASRSSGVVSTADATSGGGGCAG